MLIFRGQTVAGRATGSTEPMHGAVCGNAAIQVDHAALRMMRSVWSSSCGWMEAPAKGAMLRIWNDAVGSKFDGPNMSGRLTPRRRRK